jgi:putative spermidine/putrescine transport system substrate-binding protein
LRSGIISRVGPKDRLGVALALIVGWVASPGCRPSRAHPDDRTLMATAPWDSVLARARGTTVTWLMWRGDPSINAYVDEWVTPRLRTRFGISLITIDAQGPAVLNALVVEREAGRAFGTADLVWINGETFHNLRRERLLYGPWAGRQPAAALVDSASPVIARDFGEFPLGYESPWGRVEFAFIYDSARLRDPPRTLDALAEWVRAHPGEFTYDQDFTGLAFVKALMYHLGGGVRAFDGPFDSARYVAASARVWRWLDRLRPALWRRGEAYPHGVAELEQMFANREVEFAMSYNENEVVSKARQTVIPPTSRAFVMRDGALANAHFLGIPFNAPNPAGAMVVADFLLSPEAQLEKLHPDVWGDGTVLARSKLPASWMAQFTVVGSDPRQIPRDPLDRYAVPEVNPRYGELLQADWRTHVRSSARALAQ